MADAQAREVGHLKSRIIQGETGMQLHALGRAHGHWRLPVH